MTEVFLAESLAVRLHIAVALFALAFGPLVLYRRRRDIIHKGMGYTWVSAMAIVAASGFFIPAGIVPLVLDFGVIHILAVLLLLGLASGVAMIRSGRRDRHERLMWTLYWWVMWITGLFTLLPGRVMNEMLFAAWPPGGVVAIALGLGLIGWVTLRTNSPVRRQWRRKRTASTR